MQGTKRRCIAPMHCSESQSSSQAVTCGKVSWCTGGRCACMQDTVGSFEVGKEFDAIMVDTDHSESYDVFPTDSALDKFEKFANLGDDRNIRAVWIQGGLVTWK